MCESLHAAVNVCINYSFFYILHVITMYMRLKSRVETYRILLHAVLCSLQTEQSRPAELVGVDVVVLRNRVRNTRRIVSDYWHTHTHTRRFNRHFPRKPGLASCHLDSQSPFIHNLSILTGRAKTHIFPDTVSHPPCTSGCCSTVCLLILSYFGLGWLHNGERPGITAAGFYRLYDHTVRQPTESKHWRRVKTTLQRHRVQLTQFTTD